MLRMLKGLKIKIYYIATVMVPLDMMPRVFTMRGLRKGEVSDTLV